jgi:hypothetical protein
MAKLDLIVFIKVVELYFNFLNIKTPHKTSMVGHNRKKLIKINR